jgi:protein SCO1
LVLSLATQAFGQATEHLTLPDAPVFDASATGTGFVTRLSGQGTVIISFSFLDCTTICPISNTIPAKVDDRIDEGALPLTIVTLSIDPVNDTPSRLAEAATAMGAGPRWLWLTASPQDTWLLRDSLGLPPGPIEDHDQMFLVGNAATGDFLRVIGLPEPDQLIDLAMGF